jgi:hypothetical protein
LINGRSAAEDEKEEEDGESPSKYLKKERRNKKGTRMATRWHLPLQPVGLVQPPIS